MTVVYNQATINARLADVVSQISGGSLVITDAGGISLASLPLSSLSVSSGVLIFGPSSVTIAANGNAALGKIVNGSSTPVSGLTVGTSSAFDIVVSTTQLIAGQVLSLTSGQITGR